MLERGRVLENKIDMSVCVTPEIEPRGIFAALGFAKAWNPARRSTNKILAELRSGNSI